jgi:general secretion pathway protein F
MHRGESSDKIGFGKRHLWSTPPRVHHFPFGEQIRVALFEPLVPQCVSLDDFLALNDEIAALARAGVPLGRGLLDLGGDLPGRLGRLTTDVGRRLEQGETLEQVVSFSPELFPPGYLAVIQAGLKVGRLPAALEGISNAARRTAQMQRSIGLGMLYPLFLLGISYVLLVFWIHKLAPVMGDAMSSLNPATASFWNAIAAAGEQSWWWGPLVPLVLVAWMAWQWWRSQQVARGVDLHPLLSLGVVWRLWRMRQCARLAAMTDLLALLTEYGVPLPRAVELAGAASGDRRLKVTARDQSERLARGERVSTTAGFPPFLAWVVGSGNHAVHLPDVLRRLGDSYKGEAQRHSQWLTTFVPLILTAVIGGITVALMAAIYFGPFVLILYQLIDATTRVT